MGFQVSPGVNVTEIDLTTIVPAVSTTEGALAGVFQWGPVEDRTLVSSQDELAAKFGAPNSNNFETFFTGANFLDYGNKLYVSRAAANSNNAVAGPGINATSNGILVKNEADYGVKFSTYNDGTYYYVAKSPGALGNSLRVAMCDSVPAYTSTFDRVANNIPSFNFVVGSNVAVITVTNSDANTTLASNTANNILAGITVGDFIKVGNAAIGYQFVQITNKTTVSAVNSSVSTANLALENVITLSTNVSMNTISRYWEFYSVVDSAPTTTNYLADRGGSGDELHVVIVDELGKFSGTPGTILETFPNLSRATDALGEQGGSIYYKNVINQSSKYVWWLADRAGTPSKVSTGFGTLTPNTTPFNTQLFGGTDGADESTITNQALSKAYDQFKSAEDIDISLVLAGKARGGVLDTQQANYLIDNICENRLDCVAFISPRREAVVQNYLSPEEDLVDFRNQLRSTSYGFLDSGYKYQYDKYNDVYRYVPLNGDIAGLAVRTDTTRDPWWSFAGFNRGQIKNVINLAWNPDKAHRDILYKSNINPVVSFPGEGVILYGDKTLLTKPSAFDRINVRRLFIVLEKAISTAAKYSLFEFNDEFTRAQFRNMVEPYLRDVKGRRGIYDFKVVCDETNNTGEVIDRNEFVGDIYIKPARSINYIQLNFVAVRTSVEFNEVVGKF